MKEKILELSDISSEQGLSITQTQRNHLTSTCTEGDVLFNLSSTITKSGVQQTIISKNKIKPKEKKSKCNCFYRNMKKISECLKSFMNHLYCFTGKNIRLQVCITYSFLLIFMIIIIIYLKFVYILNSINSLSDKNYFLFYVNNIIDSQREIKVQLDEINNHDLISEVNEPLLFLRIYTEEMVENGILKEGTIKLENNLNNIYENLGENYILSNDLVELSEIRQTEKEEDENTDNIDYNIKNLIPFYYHFTPIFIEHLNKCGIKLNNFYFVAKEMTSENIEDKAFKSMYFKYPLEKMKIAPDVPQENDKIFDFILDPYIDSNSNSDFEGQSDVIDSIRSNNWFYNCLKDENNHYRIFTINKLSEEKIRKNYFLFFSRSVNLLYDKKEISDDNSESNTKIFFTFSMKINHDEDNYPFIELNQDNDILLFDYLSIYNFGDNFQSINLDINKMEQKFEIDYDLDDEKNILIRIPKFISNIHRYSMVEKNNDKIYNKDQSKLLKYKEMKNMDKVYEINYYFQKDSLIFRLIYFLNKFFEFKKVHPEYLTEEYDDSRKTLETASEHPCEFQGTDEYYEKIKLEYDYDCLNDFCLYNNCDQTKNNLKELYFMPYCYCIPLFCRDNQSPDTDFHKKLKEKIEKINPNMSENAYAFTSSYKDYLMKKEYNFSKIDQYFDRKNFIFNCKLFFEHKNNSYNNFFRTKIKFQNLAYKSKDTNFLMFFMNNNMTSFVVSNLKRLNYIYFISIFAGYIICLIGTLTFLIYYILCQVNNLLNRMEKVKNIRTTLITNEESKNNLDENISSTNISESESIINYKDDKDNISVKSNDIVFKKSKNEKEQKKEEKKVAEMDELDTLIQLINDNLSEFQIKFNLNEDMNTNINEIKKQYNGIIKINQYKNKLLNNNSNKSIDIHSFDDDDEQNSDSDEKIEKFDNLSLKMFYELLSTSTSVMDFSNIKRNFYYKKHDEKLLFGLKELLACFDDEDSKGNGEITNINKIQNAINYYYNNIHKLWETQYENMKKDEVNP